MSKFDFSSDSVVVNGTLDVDASVELFRERLTAWAEETAAIRSAAADAVDAVFTSLQAGQRKTANEVVMRAAIAMGATEGDALTKATEAIVGYLQGSGLYNSKKGPGGGWARNS